MNDSPLQQELLEINRRLSDQALKLVSYFSSESGQRSLEDVWSSFQQVRSTASRMKKKARAFADILDAHPAGGGARLSRIGIPVFPDQVGFTHSAGHDAGRLLLLGSLHLNMFDLPNTTRQSRLWDIIMGADVVNTVLRNALLGKPFDPEPKIPPVILDYVEDLANRTCVFGVEHAMAGLRLALGATVSRSHADGIKIIEPSVGCAGELVTIRGAGFGPSQPSNVDVYFPTAIGGCKSAKVKSWSDKAIEVYVPKDVGIGCIGFVVRGQGGRQSLAQAVSAFIGEVTGCFGPLVAEPIRAGYQSLATGALRVPCPPCLSGGLNRFTGGPPVIEFILGQTIRNKLTLPGSGVADLTPGDMFRLTWKVTNATKVMIYPIAINGQLHELPAIPGPFAQQGTTLVSWSAGNNPLVFATFPWDAAYEIKATNKCGSATRQIKVRMRMAPKALPGPSDFLWGVATAGRQVEGGLTEDDWHIFTTDSQILNRLHNFKNDQKLSIHPEDAGVALDHWAWGQFARSVERARALGLNAYRFSIEWSRIEPSRGRFDSNALGNYQMMIAAVRANGMEPIVVLNHLSLPAWVQTPPREASYTCCVGTVGGKDKDPSYLNSLRGWETIATVDAFVRYVEFVVSAFAKSVSWWITFNEPLMTSIPTGYLAGVFPPGFFGDGRKAKIAIHNIIMAHARAYESIHAIDANASVGITDQWIFCKDVLDPNATKQFVYYHQDYLINALVHGIEDREISLDKPKHERVLGISSAKWKPHLDFFGLQYYKSAYPYHFIPLATIAPWFGAKVDLDLTHPDVHYSHNLLNDMGWEICPEGLYKCLMKLKQIGRFKGNDLRILVAENGTAEITDHNRSAYITSHLQQLQKARKDGARVEGYLHWSISDNWEWIDGYRQEARFGLFSVQLPTSSFTHSITEGGLTLSYATENPTVTVDEAVSRYGRYKPDGVSVEHPAMSPYSVWNGTINTVSITLLFASLPGSPSQPTANHTNITGLIFYADTRRWIRLSNVIWQPISHTLQFSHHKYSIGSSIPERIVSGTLSTNGMSVSGQVTESSGNVMFPNVWQAARLLMAGMWQAKIGADLMTLSLSCAEGTWTGRVLSSIEWLPLTKIEINPTGFTADLTGIKMVGLYSGLGSTMTVAPWGVNFQRLSDGLPF